MTLTNGDLKAIKGLVGVAIDERIGKRGLATKEDLKNFATKEDLGNFATKDDLKLFATKEDIKSLATKKDVQKIDKKFDKLFDFLDKDFSKTKREVRDIQEHFDLPVAAF